MDLYGAPWLYEKISLLKEGRTTTRIRGSAFLWSALILFLAGVALVANEIFIGGALALTVSPCLLLYPVIRTLFGWKESIGTAITTVVVEEFLKREIVNSIEKPGKKRGTEMHFVMVPPKKSVSCLAP